MKKGKKLWFVVLLVIGIVASGCVYFAFNANMVEVVVANQTVQGNVEITNGMLSTKKIDKAALPENYLEAKYIKDMVGRYTNIGITKGSVFTTGNVATKDSKKAAVIPDGKTLLSITIDSLPQGVEAGDYVNLLVGINMQDKGKVVMTYQNVKVTSAYVDVDGNVTGLEVEVTPAQAQKIQYAQINGELSVSLLPLGYEDEELPLVDESEIRQYSSEKIKNDSGTDTNVTDNKTDSNEVVDVVDGR